MQIPVADMLWTKELGKSPLARRACHVAWRCAVGFSGWNCVIAMTRVELCVANAQILAKSHMFTAKFSSNGVDVVKYGLR